MKNLPYLPAGKEILYVPVSNQYMQIAQQTAEAQSLDKQHPTGAVLVKNQKVIGRGANGSGFHEKIGCVRKLLKAPTGKFYALCSGCSPKNHAEQKAIKATQKGGNDPKGADIYLWGHWWCCESCWAAMMAAGIQNVYLPEGAWEQFAKNREEKPLKSF